MAHAPYRQPCRHPHHPRHACRADASRGSAAHTRGEKCAMPVRLHAERRLLHAHVSSCPCSRPEGREMPARIRTQRQRLLRSPRALTQVATAATNEPSAAVTCPTEVCYLSVGARETCLCSNGRNLCLQRILPPSLMPYISTSNSMRSMLSTFHRLWRRAPTNGTIRRFAR